MIWFITRYDDAVAVLADDVRFTRDPARGFSSEKYVAYMAETPEAVRFIDDNMRANAQPLGDRGRRARRARRSSAATT